MSFVCQVSLKKALLSWADQTPVAPTLLLALVLASGCGTEGGNPHRQDPDPTKDEGTDENREDFTTPENTSGPSESAPGEVPTDASKEATQPEPLPACTFTHVVDTSATAAPGFYVVDISENQDFAGKVVTLEVTPEGGATVEGGAATPLPGKWSFTLNLQSSSADSVLPYCQATLVLSDGTLQSARINISIAGRVVQLGAEK